MSECFQFENISVLKHGEMVHEHYLSVIDQIKNSSNDLPKYIKENSELILSHLLPLADVKEYHLYHDCGKPFCEQTDSEGKKHFPHHAAVSAKVYAKVSSNYQVINLISMDMIMHEISAEDLVEFSSRPEAMTLWVSALAEISANSEMFGGKESISYKIKLKHLERRGKALLKLIKK